MGDNKIATNQIYNEIAYVTLNNRNNVLTLGWNTDSYLIQVYFPLNLPVCRLQSSQTQSSKNNNNNVQNRPHKNKLIDFSIQFLAVHSLILFFVDFPHEEFYFSAKTGNFELQVFTFLNCSLTLQFCFQLKKQATWTQKKKSQYGLIKKENNCRKFNLSRGRWM